MQKERKKGPKKGLEGDRKKRERVRIQLMAFDHVLLDQTASDIVEAAKRTGATIEGPVPFPTRKEKFVVLTAPNIDKDARDQYEIRTYKRLIYISFEPTARTLDALFQVNLASGVGVKVLVASTNDAESEISN